MSLRRFAKRRDANEPELIKEARKLGWWCIRLDKPSDWLACRRGIWYPVEIKGEAGSLTDNQQKFVAEADRRHAPVLLWRTLEDVIECSK